MNQLINKALKIAKRDNRKVYAYSTYCKLCLEYSEPKFIYHYFIASPDGTVTECKYQYNDNNERILNSKVLNPV